MEYYGILRAVVSYHLLQFAKEYAADLRKYPELLMVGPFWNFDIAIPFYEIGDKYNWYLEHAYNMEEIQFVMKKDVISKNPHRLLEFFDINFGLFNGLIPKIIKDYENAITLEDPLLNHESHYINSLAEINQISARYGFDFSAVKKPAKKKTAETENEDDFPDQFSELENMDDESEVTAYKQFSWIHGNIKKGQIYVQKTEKIEGFQTGIQLGFQSDILKNTINFFIKLNGRGKNCSSIFHQTLNRLLEGIALKRNNHFINGKIGRAHV